MVVKPLLFAEKCMVTASLAMVTMPDFCLQYKSAITDDRTVGGKKHAVTDRWSGAGKEGIGKFEKTELSYR